MKNGIALLITLMFVMLISVGIGYGLMQLKGASKVAQDENLMYESSMVLDDVLTMLQKSPDLRNLADNNSSDELYAFLQSSKSLPLEMGDEKVVLSFESARSHLNINSLNKTNESLFRDYFTRYMVGSSYVDILKECMSKNQVKGEYNNYTSTLFDEYPRLFRDYIASKKQLAIINKYYLKEYGDTNLKNISFDKLFSYSEDENEMLDVNYITPAVWELITGASQIRAEQLHDGEGSYNSLKDLHLTEREKKNINKFKITFFAPYLFVKIEIYKESSSTTIRFKYDIKLKKGYDFVFEV
jgi:hypothetical protein